FAQLRLAAPTLLLPGDRFILRQFSPVVTTGGGNVLDTAPLRKMADREAFLRTLIDGDVPAILRARIRRRQRAGVSVAQLVSETGWQEGTIERGLKESIGLRLVLRAGDQFIDASAAEELSLSLLTTITAFHKQ